jgi:hypothetical protein
MTQQTEAVEVPADTTEVTDVVQVPAATTGEADEMDGELRLALTENSSRACGLVGGHTHSGSAADAAHRGLIRPPTRSRQGRLGRGSHRRLHMDHRELLEDQAAEAVLSGLPERPVQLVRERALWPGASGAPRPDLGAGELGAPAAMAAMAASRVYAPDCARPPDQPLVPSPQPCPPPPPPRRPLPKPPPRPPPPPPPAACR